MQVAVGLTTSDLKSLDHHDVVVTSAQALEVFQLGTFETCVAAVNLQASKSDAPMRIAAGGKLRVTGNKEPDGFVLRSFSDGKKMPWTGAVLVRSAGPINVASLKRAGAAGTTGAKYNGTIVIYAIGDHLRIALVLDVDKYLGGVLQSEIPASYHLEAVKAQAVAARTYGLNPRISHSKDLVNVCDSFLCCQYFGGLTTVATPTHERAIHETLGEVLIYEERPILALFSSCAGGHTENYENCFSDPATGQFPPPALPYLVGVPETAAKKKMLLNDEKQLRQFYAATPYTVDASSNHFKWRVQLTDDDIEAHMHATVKAMMKDERAPFVVAPLSGKFGEVQAISVLKRGVSGCAIEVEVKTSSGNWKISKELVIRDLFKTPEKKLARLKSARIFLDHEHQANGDLKLITISGLGWGHGVGLQQTGAQGWAKEGWSYRSILSHYFTSAVLAKF